MKFSIYNAVTLYCLICVPISFSSTNETDRSASQPLEIEAEKYPYFLPFLGQKAIDAGEEIPLPLGISAAFYHVTRDIDVASISASINDQPLQSVDDNLSVDVTTHVNTGSLRMDAWIFPFLNIYGLVGEMDNTSEINANVTIGGTDYALRADGSFSGIATGFGTVLAGGYMNYFMTLDANWVYSDLGDKFDTRFSGQIYNARLGWKGKIKRHNTRIWLGATYWDTEREMSGSISTGGSVVQKINFKVVQKPVNPGNMSIGFNYEFTKKVNLVADYGFNLDDAQIFLVSLNYRFF